MSQRKAVVITTTLTHPNGDNDVRFELACELVSRCRDAGHKVIVAEKYHEENYKAVLRLKRCGATVIPQSGSTPGLSRRVLFSIAQSVCVESSLDGVLWTEEKPYMANYLDDMIERMRAQQSVALIPRRSEISWESWPKFQYYSEHLGNEVYRRLYGESEDGLYDIMHGPVYFGTEVVSEVLNFRPTDYDISDVYIQHFVPAILMSKGLKIATLEVECEYPPMQRAEEEGSKFREMISRRLDQVKTLVEADVKIYQKFFAS